MIESCPKRHMLLGITSLAVLTIVVLIVESRWTPPRTKQFPIENNSTCWLKEDYEVIQDCHPCTELEIKSRSIGVCIHTHNKELLRCASGETVTRSCDRVAWLDERNFWAFEALMFVSAFITCLISSSRRHTLDRRALQRVQRQLAQSV
ncbi:protein JTB-like [Ctenocephalides felis]|uniref:protein JTB-like n=1 Tax=Ctenocephalides felis TaxID=7515 RepID=UPI000E6E3149|nr:protein JTB-like [Ctenocephalides felis]XP_026466520.1 protein JTB-like [Ctenocephalides felis]